MKKHIFDTIIIGAGLSGLSVAAFLKKNNPSISLLVLEKNEQPGGAISSYAEEGYLAESGAHGFLDNCQESRELTRIAGLENEIIKAPLSRYGRYICLNQKLKLIPQKPGLILRSNIMPFAVKLRVLADLWKKPLPGEPTVEQWVQHRFGSGLLPFADAVFTGTYAGDIKRLKMDAVMPGVRSLENDHGSVIRGLLKKRKQNKKGDSKKRPQLPAMTSFINGMSRFPQALADTLLPNKEIMYRTPVTSFVPGTGCWEVHTSQHQFRTRHLVVALPVNQALTLLKPAPTLARPPLEQIPEARIATVALGYNNQAKVPFGFGYLAPESEKRFTMGSLFSSHMFPDRAPQENILIEALIGGRRHPERLALDDETIIENVTKDIGKLIDLPDRPSFSRVLRPQSAIPQLEAGYPNLISWRNTLQRDHPSVHICGFGWKGIGINDMTKEAKKISDRILAGIDKNEKPEVKGVYF